MSETNTETGETTSRSPRFTQWVAFLVFSTITLGSAVEAKNTADSPDDAALKNQRWAVACASITFALTTIMVAMQLHPIGSLFVVGTKIEGTLCILLSAFWAATVSVVSDARHGLAVDSTGAVKNGNLYYFSWAGFVCAIMISVSYLRAAFGVDVAGEIRSRSARLTTWSAILASSLIVMGACANILDQDCSSGQTASSEYCKRTKYGLALGAIGTFLALAVVGMKIATTAAPFTIEASFSFILTVMYAFGVAYITSSKGPGSALGNLYYFSWISLVCAFMLGASCVEDYKSAKAGGAGKQGNDDGDIQVESLDDTI